MIIQPQGFSLHLPSKSPKLCIITGNNLWLAEQFTALCKKTWGFDHPEETAIHRAAITRTEDWASIFDILQHPDLFATHRLLSISYDKNQIDKASLSCLGNYLEKNIARTICILCAPQLSEKKLSNLAQHPDCILIPIKIPTQQYIIRWIKDTLDTAKLRYTSDLPHKIMQYHEGNVLSCAQCLEKITLCFKPETHLTQEALQPLLHDQSVYQRYALRDACLLGDAASSLKILDQLLTQADAPILLLWILTQEIRILSKIHALQSENNALSDCFRTLKIWKSQEHYYKKALSRLSQAKLYALLETALQLDFDVKSLRADALRLSFEQFILQYCR